MTPFDQAFAATVGHEGKLSLVRRDRGNWTSGEVGRGELRGSFMGVSAMSYPHLDIAALTVADVRNIFRRDFWGPVRGDELPPALALLMADAAYHSGVQQAARWLQAAVGVAEDGVIGPATLRAVAQAREREAELVVELLTQRALFLVGLGSWRDFGRGWLRRLFGLALQSRGMGTWT